MNLQMNEGLTSENVIIVDAAYIDKVAFNLIVNFERMLGRQIPPADMARWIDCIALDGGLREGASNTQVVLVYEKDRQRLNNFVPASMRSSTAKPSAITSVSLSSTLSPWKRW